MGSFIENLRKIMQERKLTQSNLAETTGISQAAISRYMKGLSSPGARELYSIARALDVSMDYLWSGARNTDSEESPTSQLQVMSEDDELSRLKNALGVIAGAVADIVNQHNKSKS